MNLDYKAIGKRIKIARIKADMSQEYVAEMSNISPSHMSNIETGTTRVSLKVIVNIANIIGVTVDDLLFDNLVHARVQYQNELQAALDGCNDYEIRVVADAARSILSSLRMNEQLRKSCQGL